MRVITGIYKGRHFDVPRSFKARPTTDFAKENLFNVLNGYLDFEEEPEALDLFCRHRQHYHRTAFKRVRKGGFRGA